MTSNKNKKPMSEVERRRKMMEEHHKMVHEWYRKHQGLDKPLEQYCCLIRGIKADDELTSEEHEKLSEEGEAIRKELRDEEMQRRKRRNMINDIVTGKVKPPKGTTKTAILKQLRRERKVDKEYLKQEQADSEFVRKMAPVSLLIDDLKAPISRHCRCEASKIRQGEFCDVCRLIAPIHKDMIALFRDAAEHRK